MSAATIVIAIVAQWVALAGIMAAAWRIQQRTGNAGYVDAVWTFGLGAVGAVSALAPVGGLAAPSGRQLLVAVIVLAWSLRLGTHIVQRSRRRGDDPRYAALIRGWGADAAGQMFVLLQKQALVSVPMALTLFLAAHNPLALFRVADLVALVLLVTAVVGEAIADRQLRAFAATSAKGRICDRGLWAWSRHPNYFFEWLFWVGLALLAIDTTGAYPWGWLALSGPLCMYWLLVYVSGIPPLEQHMLERYGEAYRAYQARTSAFFPLPPRHRA
jgi:steroid 5-alpha reductase family enzyme